MRILGALALVASVAACNTTTTSTAPSPAPASGTGVTVSGDVTVIDVASRKPIKTIKVGRYPWGAAMRP